MCVDVAYACLGGALRFCFVVVFLIVDFLDFRRIWHLGGFGDMENTPTVCANDLPTFLRNFKNDPKSRSVNNVLQRLDFEPGSIHFFVYQPKLRPYMHVMFVRTSFHAPFVYATMSLFMSSCAFLCL